MMLTVVTTPVDVDAAPVGTGELSQREAGGVCWKKRRCKNQKYLKLKHAIPVKQQYETAEKTHHKSLAHQSGLHSHRPGHMSRR